MNKITDRSACHDRLLLIFAPKGYARRRIYDVPEGENRIFLSREELMLAEDVELLITCREESYGIFEEKLCEGHPFYFETKGKEKLLLLLTKELSEAEGTVWFTLGDGECCQIGSAYQSRIFYDCCGLVSSCHGRIVSENGDHYACPEHGKEGIYVNERVLSDKRKLQAGDRVDLYGLHMLYLREFLVCTAFSGVMRAALAGGEMVFGLYSAENRIGIQKEAEGTVIERKWAGERQLPAGKVTILTPSPRTGETQGPLMLSVGPSLTMALPMIVMAFAGSRMMSQGSNFYLLSMLTGLCSAALAVFWGLSNWGYRRYAAKKAETCRVAQYREYLKAMEKELSGYREENRSILERRYPKAEEFQGKGRESPKVLWNRYYRQEDFLFLRLGTGTASFPMEVELAQKSTDIVPDKLYQEGSRLAEAFRVVDDVPVGIDFFAIRQLGIVADPDREESYRILFQLLVQLAACHCYTEMKVVCFYDKAKYWQQSLADSIRFMPHIWSPNGKVRFLAGDEKDSGEIIPALMGELEKRKEDSGISLPWYLVLVLDKELVQGEILCRYLTDDETAYPVSAVFMEKERENLPKNCRGFLQIRKKQELVIRTKKGITRQAVMLEGLERDVAVRYFRAISGFRVRETGMEEQIPEKVDFLELYGCGSVQELKSRQRWKNNHPGKRLKVPVGRGQGGKIISLDIHEKFHGPHGLIAGTTGFGKSELIMTFLLSIAVSFSPEDVNFFMIDYKGGGTGNVLKNLPHCAGAISNLSGKQIKRAMSAITSENRQRQQILGRYGVNHIDAYTELYREGKADSPMPHLILVVDEFAQLRKEEPEFMQEIISLSQVGRSLGIHLILATQKPAGTVDDRIWSNARFHLCLKVQDKKDSMDMLHNSDAAMLLLPGQCYLQIGNHEYYELFQTGYCGEPYREKERKKQCAVLVENTGKRLQTSPVEKKTKESQLEAVINYVSMTAGREGTKRAKSLWMPELAVRISLEDVREIYGSDYGQGMELLLGMCDDPENQRQFPLVYQPLEAGNFAVCGGPLSGKSELLRLIAWQIFDYCGSKQPVLICADLGQGNMRNFLDKPGVLGGLWEKEGKDIFFYHLERLFIKRKESFRGRGGQGTMQSVKEFPDVFFLIDNISSLLKALEERQQEFLIRLAAEGMGYGIYMVISAASPGEIPGKMFEKFKTVVALEMSDRFAYGDILRQYHLPVLPKENTKGRGICKAEGRVLEFQAAVAPEHLSKPVHRKEVAAFPHLPSVPDYPAMVKDYRWKADYIPLGYSLATGEIREVNFMRHPRFLLSCHGGNGRGFLKQIEKSLLYQGRNVVWAENEDILTLHKTAGGGCCFLAPDLAGLIRMISWPDEERGERIAFWERLFSGKGKDYFMAGAYDFASDGMLTAEPFFRAFSEEQVGVHLGGNGGMQRVFSFDDLGYARLNQREAQGVGYWKQGVFSQTERLLIPGLFKENDDICGCVCSGN